MKRQLIVGLSLGAALSVATPLFVYAQQDPAPQPGTAAVAPSDSKSELNARLEKRTANQKIRLNNAEAARVSARCGAAQQKLAETAKKFSENDKPLRAKYEAYIARLGKIGQKAEARGIDTTEFKTNVAAFTRQHEVMVGAINEFNLSMSDVRSVDCKTDPTAFKSTLEAARAELNTVKAARAELAKIAKGPLLESIKAIKVAAQKEKN